MLNPKCLPALVRHFSAAARGTDPQPALTAISRVTGACWQGIDCTKPASPPRPGC